MLRTIDILSCDIFSLKKRFPHIKMAEVKSDLDGEYVMEGGPETGDGAKAGGHIWAGGEAEAEIGILIKV